MEYRYLGKSGLQVSCLGFGNMVNFRPEDEVENVAIIKTAYDAGVNFFDTAELYENGQAEAQLGRSIQKLSLPREKLVVTTKIFTNTLPGQNVNRVGTLSRKHVQEGVDTSLKNLQLEYVDVLYAHGFDHFTPIEEVCRGFNQVIEDGKAFYWGTSNWNVSQLQEAMNVCDRLGLHRPVAEQGEYNMLVRQEHEVDLAPLVDNYGLGFTSYSPLGGGLLTGKYNSGEIPADSRAGTDIGWLTKERSQGRFFNHNLSNAKVMKSLNALGELAKEFGCTQSQLSIAWVMRNKDVSSTITGARSTQQLTDTLKSLEVLKKFTPELDEQIEKILDNRPAAHYNFRKWSSYANRR